MNKRSEFEYVVSEKDLVEGVDEFRRRMEGAGKWVPIIPARDVRDTLLRVSPKLMHYLRSKSEWNHDWVRLVDSDEVKWGG